jgi:molecular chaperone DnaJ
VTGQDWLEKDFYSVLGVPKDADAATIKKAYRKLARQEHPDHNPGDAKAEARFKDVGEAYAVLSDPEQRGQYDQLRAMAGGPHFTAGGRGGAGFEDVFGGMFGGGGGRSQQQYTFQQGGGAGYDDLLGGLFGQQGGGRFGQPSGGYRGFGGPSRGNDITASATIDFITATQGDTITLQTSDGRPIKVKIPAGVADGQKIKLRGKGRPGDPGAPAGDLILTVSVDKHPVFGREGDNLTLTVPVGFDEAALGAQIKVPTLSGSPVTLRVPAGTPNGRVFRVRGRGSARKDGSKGDLLVTVEVQVPALLDDAARAAVTAYREATAGTDPRAALFERTNHGS